MVGIPSPAAADVEIPAADTGGGAASGLGEEQVYNVRDANPGGQGEYDANVPGGGSAATRADYRIATFLQLAYQRKDGRSIRGPIFDQAVLGDLVKLKIDAANSMTFRLRGAVRFVDASTRANFPVRLVEETGNAELPASGVDVAFIFGRGATVQITTGPEPTEAVGATGDFRVGEDGYLYLREPD